MTVEIEIEIDTEMDTEIEIVMEIDTEMDTDTETDIGIEILPLLTLQPHNLAHPQPFSDGEVGTASESPFGFPRAA